MTTKISVYLGIIVAVITLTVFGVQYDNRIAKAEDVNKAIQGLSTRLEQKIQEDKLDNIQERIWRLEDRYGHDCSNMPQAVLDTYRSLLLEKEDVERILKQLMQDK
ncbi:MAG: hypothetical protein DRJ03_01215 [Chloroflexi bacterium]|nr:MAG: hypothetical protein DRJ03_01215 [Chloroflexota bacterium]